MDWDREEPFDARHGGAGAPEGDLLANLSEQRRRILQFLLLSPAQIMEVVGPMMSGGQYYEAARSLEISAQQHLGTLLTGDELIDPDVPDFGEFHLNIRNLLWAGALYMRGRRTLTGQATLRRALIFVEEGLRRIRSVQGRDNGQVACVGLAFEMAGHCSSAISDPSGRDYYQAAENYWDKSAQLCPEELPFWYNHPVTGTVISCLNPVVQVKHLDEQFYPMLFTQDYRTRLESAQALLI